jgi:hypothetical protein
VQSGVSGKSKANPNLAKSAQIQQNLAKPGPNPTQQKAWISLSESRLIKDLRGPLRAFFILPAWFARFSCSAAVVCRSSGLRFAPFFKAREGLAPFFDRG